MSEIALWTVVGLLAAGEVAFVAWLVHWAMRQRVPRRRAASASLKD